MVIGASFISPKFKNELSSIKCDSLIKYLMGLYFATLSDTNVNIGDAFCYFSLYATSVFFFGYADETSGGRLGERCPVVS